MAAFVIGWLWSFKVARAADYGLKLTTSVTVQADSDQANVKQVFSVTGSDKTNLPAKAEVNLVGIQPAGLSANGPDKSKLTAQYDEQNNRVLITIPKERRSSTQAWSFSLTYRADVLGEYGALKAVQIPALNTNLQITGQTTVLSADLDLGFATVRSFAPSKTAIGVGQQILTFNNSKSPDESMLIVFGDQTYANVNFSTKLENHTWWWNEIGLTLPPDTNQQHVFLESIQPAPTKVKLDKDGNVVAYFRIGPLSSRDVEVTARATISNPTYQLDAAQPVSNTEQLLSQRYTKLTEVWQPIGLNLDIKDDATAADVAQAVFDGVVAKAKDEMTRQESFSQSPRSSALKMSDWLVGELRSRGIPARLVLGLMMSDGDQLSATPRQHAWVEANLAGVGWVTMDPYFGLSSGSFGAADPLRIGLALWGLEDDRPPVDLSLAQVEFSDQAPPSSEPTGRLSVSARKYMVLPLVGIFNQSVKLSPGTIVDDVNLSDQHGQATLGSLAPFQQATQRSLVFGTASYSQEKVVGQIGDDETTISEATASVSYLVLYIEGGLILLLLLGRWWRRKRATQPKSHIKPSKEALTLHDEALGGSIEQENLVTSPAALAEDDAPADEPVDKPPQNPSHRPPPKLVQ